MLRKIQVVSFQMPYPANYGGVIDVYYKLKALHDAGVYVVLHTFIYDRSVTDKIKDIVDEVYYYQRKKSFIDCLSCSPFIVKSRKSDEMVRRIKDIGAPVILEGLHTCAILKDLRAEGMCVAVRTHNIEHKYYDSLSKASNNLIKKLYYKIESIRLKRFEPEILKASTIFPISDADMSYFSRKYPKLKMELIYPFFDDSVTRDDIERAQSEVDVLYHGNLDVIENRRGLEYIVESVLPFIDKKYKLTVAGHCSSKNFTDYLINNGVRFINHPTDSELEELISDAKVNLFVSFQSTGVKLKLLNALAKGKGVCVVNSPMVPDNILRKFCVVADSGREIASNVNHYLNYPLTIKENKKQREEFSRCFNASTGVETILENVAN